METLINPSRHNLPTPLSAFIGREREIAEVKQYLSAHRLVTLTGAGGSGKTRLSSKVAGELSEEFEHGISFVELASISDPALVPETIASTLNIREQPGQSLMDVLISHLSQRDILLVIDNCEHLVSACAQFAEAVLQKCPDLKILATSREALGITGEIVWSVPPLSLPVQQPWTSPVSAQDALRRYEESESVQLFVTRAKANSPGFQLTTENGAWVAEICRRLDGMPLALELAAARVRSLTVQQIAQRLNDRFRLLTGGSRTAPLRQQTLESAIDWSYILLSPAEQKVLQRLSVFAGGATLEAAETVCAGDGVETVDVLDVLSRLVDKSLVMAIRLEDGEMRYRLLETIRQYASQKLIESGEADESKNRYLAYFVEWVEKENSNRTLWLERYETEHDNLRAALDWSLTSEDRVYLGLRLVERLGWFWNARGYFSEGRAQVAAVLKKTKPHDRSELRAKVLYLAGVLAFYQTDYPVSRALAEESLSIYRELGAEGRLGLANALINLGDMWRQVGSYEKAFSHLEEGLRLMRELNDLNGLVSAFWQLGYYAVSMSDYRQAEQYFTEALSLARQKDDQFDTAVILSGLAECAVRQGNYGGAEVFEKESLMLRKIHGEKWGIAVSMGNFAWIAIHQNDLGKAGTLLLESLALRREIEDVGGMAWCLEKLAKINILNAQKKSSMQSLEYFRRAVRLFGAAVKLRTPVGSVIDAVDRPDYERMISSLRTSLGQEAFEAAWNEGQAMSLELAIEYALAEPAAAEIEVTLKEKFGGLTERERETAALIAQGKSNRAIAKAMTVDVKTIETYVTRILNKLGFVSRVQIATWMIEKGFDKKESQ